MRGAQPTGPFLGFSKEVQTKNIGILQMTGEVTDRFNEITLYGMALAILYKIYNSFSHIQSVTIREPTNIATLGI